MTNLDIEVVELTATTATTATLARRRPQEGFQEVRSFELKSFEIRQASAGDLTLVGYASVTETPYEMYGGPPWGWMETIARGAFDKTLSENPDVQLLINHADLPLARTKSGTLRLSADNVGLAVEADLDPADPDVNRLQGKMQRGDIDEMSFAFRVKRQEWDEDYTERKITEVSIHKGDVSVVNYGANPATTVDLRAFTRSLAELRAGKSLSSATMATLQTVLDMISAADDNLDDAQATLADLIGVTNPDDPDVGDVVTEAGASLGLSQRRARKLAFKA